MFKKPNIICKNIIKAHENPIETMTSFGNWIISASRDKTIKMWDDSSFENVGTITAHDKKITKLCSDEKYIYSASLDGTVKKWDPHTKECLLTINVDKGGVFDVNVCEEHILCGGEDTLVKLYSKSTGDLIREFKGSNRRISGVRFYKEKVIASSWDHFVHIFNKQSGQLECSMKGHFDAINCIDIYEDTLVSGDQTGFINIWNLKKRTLVYQVQKHKRAIQDLFLSGNTLYSASLDRSIRIWDTKNGTNWKILEGHQDATMAVIQKNNKIISGSADKTFRVWGDFSTHSIGKLPGHSAEILGTRSHGNILVSTGTDNLIKVWDIKKRKLIKEIPLAVESWVWGLGFDGKTIVTSCDDSNYYLYDLDSGQLKTTLKGHEGSTYRTDIKDGIVITSSWDNTARVWDANTGECKFVLDGHNFPVYAVAIADDGSFLTGSSDATIRVWSPLGDELRVIYGHDNEIFHIVSWGDYVATAAGDDLCKVFNYKTGEEIASFSEHNGQVWTVAAFENLVVTGSVDKSIKVWDLEKKTCVDTFNEHSNNVKDLTISGNTLISGSFDSSIRIWDLKPYQSNGDSENQGGYNKDIEVLVSQMQLGRVCGDLSAEINHPDIIRALYGLPALEKGSSIGVLKNSSILPFFKDHLKTWRNVGNIGFAPWMVQIEKLKKSTGNGSLNQLLLGLNESPNLYWAGVLRSLKPENIPNWSFDLELSGDGPNPIGGYTWTKLSSKINYAEIEERDENTIVFRLTLKDIPLWLLPMLKGIFINISDDRGDISILEFKKFTLSENGVWVATAMFQIDQGYSMEPNAFISMGDIDVQYYESLTPDSQTSVLMDKVHALSDKLETIEHTISQNSGTNEVQIEKIFDKSDKDAVSIDSRNQSESKDIFEKVKNQFHAPDFGMIKMKIGGTFDKFLEEIQPKFILFSAGTSIASAILTILTYIMIFNPSTNILGDTHDILGNILTTTEIAIFIIVYFVLLVFLILNTWSWVKYQIERRKQKII